MTRLFDWRSRLFAEIDRVKHARFAWGTNDCVVFVARCVKAMTGVDHRAGVADDYTNAEGAAALIRDRGFKDLPTLVASYFEEIHPSCAGVGDIAVVESTEGPALGIFLGEHIGVMTLSGYGTLPRSAAARSFRSDPCRP